ncbi:cysteine peptidase family C39 domain-containing protein [Paenibacillus sp. PK4536]|uniref:peptidase domain-containing ABC transporter n=1 Tax=Paenibacillus sp. PK4536 TaxID=3024576 RepID=UPI002358B714|nr:cysteine peptidase family C39 domain-containing protein [Paenibacillus sp. PK4536]WIM40023.1 cysteine peptidase family C39 domain-containing protein [Paenibacillus sp. PK4536]
MKKYSFVKQLEPIDCGPACISMIMNYNYEIKLSLGRLKKIVFTNSNGSSFLGLKKGLFNLGIESTVYECQKDINVFDEIKLPFITQIVGNDDMNHFIVVYKRKGNKLTIGDPSKNRIITLRADKFLKEWIPFILELNDIIDPDRLESLRNQNEKINLFKDLTVSKNLLIGSWIISIVVYLLGLYLARMYTIYFDLIIPNKYIAIISDITILYLLVVLCQLVLNYFNSVINIKSNNRIDRKLVNRLVENYFNKSFSHIESYKSGELITRFSNISSIRSRMIFFVQTLPLDLITMLATFYILITINIYLSMLIIIPVIIFSLMLYLSKDKLENLSYKLFEKSEELNINLIESADNIETIKNYNIINFAKNRLIVILDDVIKVSEKFYSYDTLQTQLKNSVISIFNVLIFSLGAYLIINDNIASGILLMFNSLSMNIFNPFLNLTTLQATLEQGKVAKLRYEDMVTTIDDEHFGKKELKLIENIKMENVYFSYGLNDKTLKNINLEINNGENIALIGNSGSGKSTLAKVLSQYYVVNEGNIKINNVNMTQFSEYYLKKKIIYSPQYVELFTDSILNNITLDREIAFKDIEKIAKMIGFDKVINSFPNGYLTMLGKNGVSLSMGQMQLLNILRSTIEKYDVVIFDEITNGLDILLKEKVKNYLLNYGNIKIFITHDIDFAKSCDKIFAIKDGIISENIKNELDIEKKIIEFLS